jgi:hypothetical protein
MEITFLNFGPKARYAGPELSVELLEGDLYPVYPKYQVDQQDNSEDDSSDSNRHVVLNQKQPSIECCKLTR